MSIPDSTSIHSEPGKAPVPQGTVSAARSRVGMKHLAQDVIALALVVAGICYYLCTLSMQRLDFFDMSAFMDAGWRVYRGQRIYTDFAYNAGPIHPYLWALFFALFGFTKNAVFGYLCATCVAVAGTVYVLSRRKCGVLWSCALAAVTCATLFFPVAHPWYDVTACAFLIAAVCALWAFYPFVLPRSWLAPTGAGILVALAFMCKSNIGVAGAGVCLASLAATWLIERDFRPLAGFCVGLAVGMAATLLAIHSPADFYYQTFIAYSTSDRFSDLQKLYYSLDPRQVGPVIGLIFVLLVFCRRSLVWKTLPLAILGAGSLAVAVFGRWTGSMWVPANITLFGFGAALAYLLFIELKPGLGKKTQRLLNVWCILLLCYFGVVAYFMRLSTWSWNLANDLSAYELNTPAFSGWNCFGPIGESVDRSVDVVNNIVPPSDSLFVFPDATLIYGLTGRESYRGAPFIFHTEVFPPPGRLYEKFTSDFHAHPPDWILMHYQQQLTLDKADDLIAWLGFAKLLHDDYGIVWTSGPKPQGEMFMDPGWFLLYHHNPSGVRAGTASTTQPTRPAGDSP